MTAPTTPRPSPPAAGGGADASPDPGARPVPARWLVVPGVTLAVALLVAVVAVSTSDEPERGGARLEVDGSATLERAGGETEVVTGSTDVHPGDRVQVTDGTAQLRLRGGSTIDLRAAFGDADDSTVVVGEVPRVETGAVLVSSERSVSLEAAGTNVHVGAGAATVTRSLGVAVATYTGLTRIDSAGQERLVPALREMIVPALGRPPGAPVPLDYDPADPWDRRYLAAAMELGEQLEAMARGFTNNLAPGEGTTVGFYQEVLPGLADHTGFTDDLLDPDRPPGETLVGAAIADLGVRGSFVDRWRATFSFRDEGAAWGLVALDQGVSGGPLRGAVELALAASPLPFEGSPAPTAPPTTAPPATTTVPPQTTTTSPAPTTTATTAPPPTTTEPPPPDPMPVPGSDLSPVLEPVVEPSSELLSGLLDTMVESLLGP